VVVFFRDFELLPGEELRWVIDASHQVRRGISWSIGGDLYLTTDRLIHETHWLDHRRGFPSWESPVGEVLAVGALRRNFHPFSGGMRNRLLVGTPQRMDFFVVDGLNDVIDDLGIALNLTPMDHEDDGWRENGIRIDYERL
jgi:hypothetical protein